MKWLHNKMCDIGQWTSVTFPEQTPVGKLCHLREEIDELIKAIESGNREEIAAEYADCQILLIDTGSRLGFSAEEIDRAICRKMEINKKRKWGSPDSNGVYHHIKH